MYLLTEILKKFYVCCQIKNYLAVVINAVINPLLEYYTYYILYYEYYIKLVFFCEKFLRIFFLFEYDFNSLIFALFHLRSYYLNYEYQRHS